MVLTDYSERRSINFDPPLRFRSITLIMTGFLGKTGKRVDVIRQTAVQLRGVPSAAPSAEGGGRRGVYCGGMNEHACSRREPSEQRVRLSFVNFGHVLLLCFTSTGSIGANHSSLSWTLYRLSWATVLRSCFDEIATNEIVSHSRVQQVTWEAACLVKIAKR